MKKDKTNLTGAHIREKRRALAQGRWKRRASAIAWYGLLADPTESKVHLQAISVWKNW